MTEMKPEVLFFRMEHQNRIHKTSLTKKILKKLERKTNTKNNNTQFFSTQVKVNFINKDTMNQTKTSFGLRSSRSSGTFHTSIRCNDFRSLEAEGNENHSHHRRLFFGVEQQAQTKQPMIGSELLQEEEEGGYSFFVPLESQQRRRVVAESKSRNLAAIDEFKESDETGYSFLTVETL